MAPTSGERREVAATLRDAKRKCESRGYPWTCDDLCLAIGYEHDYEADNGIFDLLADLIDPVGDETSFALDELSKDGEELYPTRWWRCARCGEETIMMYDEGEPVACPYCGARVVRDA